MSRKTIELNGIDFEYYGDSTDHALRGSAYCGYDIFENYRKPSSYKVAVWNEWCQWASEIDDVPNGYAWIEISSHNSQVFSIHGQICIDNVPYKVQITKLHNRAWRLNA